MTLERLAEIRAVYAETEPHRAACEARYVASIAGNGRILDYLLKVAEKRGQEAARALRLAVWELRRGQA
jgi:hypothetical protein